MELDIGPVEEKEIPRLARVLKDVADEEVHVATPPGAAIRTLVSMLESSVARAAVGGGVELAARVKGRVVGGASLEKGGPRQEHVADLYLFVAKEWRGRGIGGELLDALEAEAPGLGVTKLSLNVFAGNMNARQLFESRGFEPEGVRRRHRNLGLFEEDEILMAKFLTAEE